MNTPTVKAPAVKALALGLAALIPAPMLLGASPAGTDVTVTVAGLRSAEGVVRACMSPDPARFPRCQGDAKAYRKVVPAGREVTITFAGVAPGRYAIALLHDENDNGKADRALGMMPKEGYGFSRDAKVRMAPPSFKDAVVAVDGAAAHFAIRMRYMF